MPDWGRILPPGGCANLGLYNNPNILITDHVIVTGQYTEVVVPQGILSDSLRWSALVSNGSVKITVCNNDRMAWSLPIDTSIANRKVNILVLR